MSLVSYIAFPRQVDLSCLGSKFDESKAKTVAEIRGTEYEGQFGGSLDELPDDMNIYCGDFLTDFQGIQVFDRNEAVFIGVFTNQFIYNFHAYFRLIDEKKFMEECNRNEEDSDNRSMSESERVDFIRSLVKSNDDNVAICRKQLYELVKANAYPDEIVEIYSEYINHIDLNLGPPKKKQILSLKQVLSLELLHEDRIKIEIHVK